MKYGLIGMNGRMGREIKTLFTEAKHEMVLGLDKDEEFILEKPEVLIDFSLPSGFEKTCSIIAKYHCPLVTGVTGYSDDQLSQIKLLSKKTGVVQAYNFSTGIQLLLKIAELLKNHLPGWDVEITETHHRFKKDKPSGTAKMLGGLFNNEVPIHSLRLGNVVGDHTIHFGGLGEILSVSHKALSRRTFAEGVLKSAEFILTKKRGYYSFTEVLFK